MCIQGVHVNVKETPDTGQLKGGGGGEGGGGGNLGGKGQEVYGKGGKREWEVGLPISLEAGEIEKHLRSKTGWQLGFKGFGNRMFGHPISTTPKENPYTRQIKILTHNWEPCQANQAA